MIIVAGGFGSVVNEAIVLSFLMSLFCGIYEGALEFSIPFFALLKSCVNIDC